MLVSINKVLLEHSQWGGFIGAQLWAGFILATMVELNSCAKPKVFTIWPFPQKVCQPLRAFP